MVGRALHARPTFCAGFRSEVVACVLAIAVGDFA